MTAPFIVQATKNGQPSGNPQLLPAVRVDASGRPTPSGEAALRLAADSNTFKSINVLNALRSKSARLALLNSITI